MNDVALVTKSEYWAALMMDKTWAVEVGKVLSSTHYEYGQMFAVRRRAYGLMLDARNQNHILPVELIEAGWVKNISKDYRAAVEHR